ncbi:MAG: type I 3-dehydroquinate dehydratase, partial [Bacteroidales bacterium]|nr:type I 3-dehydroquinate dehydratase [Bacteroidales bacterium]
MICVSIQKRNLEEIFAVMEREDVEMAEIRLDLCPLSDQDITELFSLCDKPLVATCRMGGMPGQAGHDGGAGAWSASEAERRLSLAMEAGAKYCDLELEAPAPV